MSLNSWKRRSGNSQHSSSGATHICTFTYVAHAGYGVGVIHSVWLSGTEMLQPPQRHTSDACTGVYLMSPISTWEMHTSRVSAGTSSG